MTRAAVALSALAFALAACSGEDGPLDAGPAPDATAVPDGGATPDAGEAADAGAPEDAGTVEDAGTPDAGARLPPLDCSGSTLRAVPTDTSSTGPWPVGVRTATVAGLRVEVWYPAVPGSEAGQPRASYDIRAYLPDSEQGKIPDDDAPRIVSEAYRGLPIDADFGPYPPVLFVHGTAGYRYTSLPQMTHWASRGFVVLAADHPGLNLRDLLITACGGPLPNPDLDADIDALVAALQAPEGDLAFLAGRIDPARLGMTGHSAGGGAIEGRGDDAAILIPMAAGGTEPGAALRATLVLAADTDQVVDYPRTVEGYEDSPSPKRFVALANAGHLAFTNLCSAKNDDGQDIVAVGTEHGVCGVGLAGGLFDCSEAYLPDPEGWVIINDASAAALEETLQCRAEAADRFGGLQTRYDGDVADVREAL